MIFSKSVPPGTPINIIMKPITYSDDFLKVSPARHTIKYIYMKSIKYSDDFLKVSPAGHTCRIIIKRIKYSDDFLKVSPAGHANYSVSPQPG